jgi:hypothetical protein
MTPDWEWFAVLSVLLEPVAERQRKVAVDFSPDPYTQICGHAPVVISGRDGT